MSQTIDANILLYASDEASTFHARARDLLARLATGGELLYLFWPTAMAYLRLATHPKIFARPLTPEAAQANIAALLALPTVRAPGEDDGFWETFASVASETVVRGNLVPDAHLVALMRRYGVRTIWTRDRDFRMFADVRAVDPFASS